MNSGFARNFDSLLRERDASTGPIGPVVDLARVWSEPNWMASIPGVEGAKALWDIPGRLADFGRYVGRVTKVDEAINNVLNEMYLAWSGPQQIEQGKTGVVAQGLGRLGQLLPGDQGPTRPGDIGMNRPLGFVGGMLAGNLEQNPDDPAALWRRTRNLSAGQSMYEEAVGLYKLPEAERLAVRASTGYNAITGTMDAVLGWFLAPDVIIGKGYKLARQQFNWASQVNWEGYVGRVVERAAKKTNLPLTPMQDGGISGALNMQVGDAQGQHVVTVVRRSELAQWQNPHYPRVADQRGNPLDPEIPDRHLLRDGEFPEDELDAITDALQTEDVEDAVRRYMAASPVNQAAIDEGFQLDPDQALLEPAFRRELARQREGGRQPIRDEDAVLADESISREFGGGEPPTRDVLDLDGSDLDDAIDVYMDFRSRDEQLEFLREMNDGYSAFDPETGARLSTPADEFLEEIRQRGLPDHNYTPEELASIRGGASREEIDSASSVMDQADAIIEGVQSEDWIRSAEDYLLAPSDVRRQVEEAIPPDDEFWEEVHRQYTDMPPSERPPGLERFRTTTRREPGELGEDDLPDLDLEAETEGEYRSFLEEMGLTEEEVPYDEWLEGNHPEPPVGVDINEGNIPDEDFIDFDVPESQMLRDTIDTYDNGHIEETFDAFRALNAVERRQFLAHLDEGVADNLPEDFRRPSEAFVDAWMDWRANQPGGAQSIARDSVPLGRRPEPPPRVPRIQDSPELQEMFEQGWIDASTSQDDIARLAGRMNLEYDSHTYGTDAGARRPADTDEWGTTGITMEEILGPDFEGVQRLLDESQAARTPEQVLDDRIAEALAEQRGLAYAEANPNSEPAQALRNAVRSEAEALPPPVIGRRINETHPVVLLGQGDEDLEALRYAAALNRANPADPPVIVRLRPDGLPVYFDDTLNPMRIDPRSDLPSDALLVTEVGQIRRDNILEIREPTADELMREQASLERLHGEAAYVPGGRLHDRLYQPDGSPREPGMLLNWGEIRDDVRAATLLYNENPELAARFLRRRQIERDTPRGLGSGRTETIADSPLVQQLINRMVDMTPDQIRRQLFPKHHAGAIIADIVGNKATSYAEKRAAILAAFGVDTPMLETLGPLARARIENLTEDMATRFPGGEAGLQARYVQDIELGMISSSVDNYAEEFVAAQAAHKAAVDDLTRQMRLDHDMQILRDTAPLRDIPKPGRTARMRETLRSSNWYQASSRPLARSIRAVVEYKPRQFLNLHDPGGDLQIVRQLEEAQPLGITATEVSHYRELYMAARSETERALVAHKVEGVIMARAQAVSGLDNADWHKVLQAEQRGKQAVQDFLKSRRYDGKGRDILRWVDDETGEVIEWSVPMIGTQLQNWLPLSDVRALIHAAKRISALTSAGRKVAEEVLDSFYHLWKPSVLLRGGWPIRVVGDEQLRMLARTGSLIEMLGALTTGQKVVLGGMFQGVSAGTVAGRAVTAPAAGMVAGIQRSFSFLGRMAEKLGIMDPEFMRLMREAGTEKLASSRASYGGPNESILREFEAFLGRTQAGVLDHLTVRGTGEWSVLTPRDRGYGDAWRRVLKDQIGRDPFAMEIIRKVKDNLDNGLDALDGVADHAVSWLEANIEYQGRLPWRANDLEKWVDDVTGMVQDYTAGFDKRLIDRTSAGTVSIDDLELVDSLRRPETVHAEIVAQALGISPITTFMRDMLGASFDVLGRLATDTLSRQPFYRWSYADEMDRLARVAEMEGRELTVSQVARMSRSSRDYALSEVKKYLYDLAETSRFGDMTRFFFPFYPAWQEALQVWSGLVRKDPSIIGRGLQIWRAPNKAGIITTDQEGNEYLTFNMSEQMADNLQLTGWQKYLATGGVRLSKTSFNMMLNGPLPGFGPVIQIPTNEVVIRRPEWESIVSFVLPLGVTSGPTFASRAFGIFSSPILKRAEAVFNGLDQDAVYQRYFIDAVTWLDHRYRSGESTMPPTLDEAHSIAGKIYAIRTMANFISPAQPILDSPLKPYMDAYRDLIDMYGPEDADEKFLQTYGEEFFAVTISRTVSRTGIPATAEAEVARREYESLITKYPTYGRLIIGEDDSVGEFSTAAFARQQSRRLNPDDPFSELERDYRGIELTESGSIREVDERLGWRAYIQALDMIEVLRKARGLPNLRVAAARDLTDMKHAITQALAKKYPGWWEEFNVRDDLKWQERIDSLRAIASSPLIADDESRRDFEGVQQYLGYREFILVELNRRKQLGGSATLDSVANHDLAVMWESLIFTILDENVAFAPIYYRYLEGDPVNLRNG